MLCFSVCGTAQTGKKIVIGTVDTLYSSVLGEQRTMLIHLPDTAGSVYHSRKLYPVVYLLDGDVHFHGIAGMMQYMSMVSHVCPEMILVGITHADRMRDLTPTHDATVPKDSNLVRTSGGGERFTSFIEKELIPYIDTHYPAAPYRVLAGHSLGGLLAVNTLVNHESLFNSYVAVDPALFWDNQKVVQQADIIFRQKKFSNKSLYIGCSGVVPVKKDSIMKDKSLATIVERSTLQFDKLASGFSGNGLQYTMKYYADEEHNSVPFIAIYDALRFIFSFTRLPDIERSSMTPQVYAKHYKAVSDKMGYTILPPEDDINSMGYYFLWKKMFDRARSFFQFNIDNYPDSYNVYDSMSDLYAAENNKQKAIEYLIKELQIKDLPYIRQKLADLQASK